MEKAVKYAAEGVKKFGVRGIFRIISLFSWYFLPFVVWIQIYRYFGQSFLAILQTIPSVVLLAPVLVLLVLITGYTSLLCIRVISLDKKLMKRIESAKEVFDKPDDSQSEGRFRSECQKFIIPHLYLPSTALLGVSGALQHFTFRTKVTLWIIQALFTLYASYSIMVFLILNGTHLNQIYTQVESLFPNLSSLSSYVDLFLQNSLLSIVLLFILSLYYNPVVSFFRGGYVRYSGITIDVLLDSLSSLSRISNLAMQVVIMPWDIRWRTNSLRYKPFTFPISLPLAIQKSVFNVEQKSPKVTKWSYLVSDERDIEALKEKIHNQKDIPLIIRFFVRQVNAHEALEHIKKVQPILYLGTVDKRCCILGKVSYDPHEGIYHSQFFFDNSYEKEQFKSIAEIEINEQKKLKPQLPIDLVHIVSSLNGEKQNGT
jgi:hypothetical protein